jgi:hypothetical protein
MKDKKVLGIYKKNTGKIDDAWVVYSGNSKNT